MSDRPIQPYHGSAERARNPFLYQSHRMSPIRHPLHLYQSQWMVPDRQPLQSDQLHWRSHWSRARYNAAHQMQNQVSSPIGKDEVNGTKKRQSPGGVETASNFSGSGKGSRKVKSRNVGNINKKPKRNSRNLRNDRLVPGNSPTIDLSQEKGQNFSSRHSLAPLACQTSPRDCPTRHLTVFHNPKDMVKSRMILGGSFPYSRSSRDDFSVTASHALPPVFNLGECRSERAESSLPSLISRQEKVNKLRSMLASRRSLSDSDLTTLEHRKYNCCSQSTCSTSRKSVIPYMKEEDGSSLILNEFAANEHSAAVCEEQVERMQKHSEISLFSSWRSPLEMRKLEMLRHGHGHCLHTKPCPDYDVKNMRICAPVSSVQEVSGSPPRVSQTNHSLLIKKTTDVDLRKEHQISKELGVTNQLKETSSCKFHSFYQVCRHSQQKVEIQILDSSTESDEEEDLPGVAAFQFVSKNQSTAEIGTKGTDNIKEDHLSGLTSSPSEKGAMMDMDLPSEKEVPSAREKVRRTLFVPELPDINLPAVPDEETFEGNEDLSTSKIHSLQMDLIQAGQPNDVKSNHYSDSCLGPDWYDRWIKRLRTGASGSIHVGTKSLSLGEATTHKKAHKMFNKNAKEIIDLDRTSNGSAGEEVMVDQKTDSDKNVESSSVNDVGKKIDDMLPRLWAQRWLFNKHAIREKQPDRFVYPEPPKPMVTSENPSRERVPSVAAMAMMGKVMNEFQRCEVQDCGYLKIWKN